MSLLEAGLGGPGGGRRAVRNKPASSQPTDDSPSVGNLSLLMSNVFVVGVLPSGARPFIIGMMSSLQILSLNGIYLTGKSPSAVEVTGTNRSLMERTHEKR